MLNDLDGLPHAFVLACLMDRQIPAERAWEIPYKVRAALGGFSLGTLSSVPQDELTRLFERDKLHRFNPQMAVVFGSGVAIIQDTYGGNAAEIWMGRPSSARIVHRFLEFHGAGVKIATMAANILARDFKIPMSDYGSIDISPDIHVRRVFERLGYIRIGADINEIIYAARERNPEYPGLFDFAVWEIGRKWCRPSAPECQKCPLVDCCPRHGV